MWILAAIVLCGSLLVRRRVGRFWLALAVYLLGSLATIAAGRVAYGGAIVALETRYLADATVPLVVTLGACLMPLRDETRPWTSTGRELLAAVPRRAGIVAAVALAALVTGLSFHAMGNYARFSTANPARAFVTNTTTSLDRLPADARVYDTEVPGGIIGPLFAQYNLVSRYSLPCSTSRPAPMPAPGAPSSTPTSSTSTAPSCRWACRRWRHRWRVAAATRPRAARSRCR